VHFFCCAAAFSAAALKKMLACTALFSSVLLFLQYSRKFLSYEKEKFWYSPDSSGILFFIFKKKI
jgi:hypothetical protein